MTTATKTAVKTTLRNAQINLLLVLETPMTRAAWVYEAGADANGFTAYVGSLKPEIRKANDERYCVSMLSLKLVKVKVEDEDGKNVVYYSRTAKGEKLAAKLAAVAE